MKRWRHRIDHGDVLESPQGEFVLWKDHEDVIRTQAAAAIAGMNSAKAVSSAQLQQAYRLNRESAPEALESERNANALLTEEIDNLRALIRQAYEVPSHNWTGIFWEQLRAAADSSPQPGEGQ